MDDEKMLQLEYKLVGTLNMFDVIPEFVTPVFENEGQLFIQGNCNPLIIENFDFLFNENMVKNVRPIVESETLIPSGKYKYEEGDEYLYAFQRSEKEIFIGTFKELKRYFNMTEIDDDFMNIEIPYFIKQIEEYKLTKKKAQ